MKEGLILLNSKCIAIYLIHKEAAVKRGAVDINSLYIPTSL